MDPLHKLRELKKPLTKRDFLLFRYEVRKDIFLGLSYLMGSCAIVLIAVSIYDFFSKKFYHGIVEIIIAVISIAAFRELHQDWAADSKKIDAVKEKMQKLNH